MKDTENYRFLILREQRVKQRIMAESRKIQLLNPQIFTDANPCRPKKHPCILKRGKFQLTGSAETCGKFLQNLREQLREVSGQLTVQDNTFRGEQVPEIVDSTGEIGSEFIHYSQSISFLLIIAPDQIVDRDSGATG